MGTKRNYSITKDKYRFNDDFGLYTDRTGTNKWLEFGSSYRDVKSGSDWSISFFAYLNQLPAGQRNVIYNDYDTNSGGNFPYGLFMAFEGNIQSLNITRRGASGTPPSAVIPFANSIGYYDQLIHCVITYETSTTTYTAYINGIEQGSVVDPLPLDSFGQNPSYTFIIGKNRGAIVNNSGFFRDYATFDKILTENEIAYIYQTGVLPQTTHANCNFYLPLNKVDYERGWSKEGATATIGFNAGVLWSDELIGDGEVEFKLLSNASGSAFGLTLDTTPVTWGLGSVDYGLYIEGEQQTGYRRVVNGAVGNVSFPQPKVIGDIIKFERISSTINVYVNNVLIHTFGGATTSNLRPVLLNYTTRFTTIASFRGGLGVTDVKLNGNDITEVVDESVNYVNRYPTIKDVSSQFDYAKVTSKTQSPNGIMYNFTDDELLLNKDTTGNLDSGAFRNFYTKNQNGLYGLKMDDLDPSFTAGYFSIPSINTNTTPTTFPNGYSIVVEGDLRRGVNNSNGDNNFYPFFDDGKRYIYVKTIGTNVTVAYTNVTLTIPIMEYFTNTSEKITSIVVTATSGGDFKMYVNGRLVAQTTETYDPLTTTTNRLIFGVPAGNSWYKRFDSIHIYETILNGNDVANGHEYKNWDDKTPYISYKSEFNGADLKELTGNGQDAILQPGAYQWTPNDIIECRSNFKTREKGLQLNGSSQYLNIPNFNPTSEKGYTVLCGFSKNDNTPFSGNQTIWSKFENVTNFFELRGSSSSKTINSIYPDGFGINLNLDLTNVDLTKPQFIATKYSKTGDVTIPYVFNSDNKVGYSMNYNGRYENNSPFVRETNLTLGFDEITANDFRIGFRASYWNGKILYMCVFKGILNDAEVKELYNNGIFRNPSINLQEKYDLELFVDFNNPFDDTGTLKFPDLSPNNHDIIANGWASLVDLQNSLINL